MTRTRRPLSLRQIAVLLLMGFTLVAAAVISRNTFERLPHLEDEFAYLYQARIFARLQAWVPSSEEAKIFWQPFVLQIDDGADTLGKRFGKYSPGWPLLLTFGVWLGQPWIVNAVLAMLSVGLTYRLGKEIFSEPVGLVAALLLAMSPMALLLNATLMSHVWAMFATVVFVYAYWRMTRHGRGRFAWAALGGLMLGGLIITRPLTAIAMAIPVALHVLWSLQRAGRERLVVLTFMAVCTLPTALLWPLFNHIWTGDWRTNTYTLLWEYDRVGFGSGYGLNPGGHSVYYGLRNARADLREYLRDLYGFTLDPSLTDGLTKSLIYGAGAGLSWIPVVVGLIAGRRKAWVWFFFGFFVAIVLAGLAYWIGSVVNGAAAYSLRYYYEATFAVCLVAGYGVVAWARSLAHQPLTRNPSPTRGEGLIPPSPLVGERGQGAEGKTLLPFQQRFIIAWHTIWPGYFILLVACGLSVFGFTPGRLREPLPRDWPNGLYRYNKVGMYQLEAIDAMRAEAGRPNDPVLIVIVKRPTSTAQDNWRNYAAALAQTSPFLDSQIVVARIFEPGKVPEIERRFSGRLVLYQVGERLYLSMQEALSDTSS